jgi:hypothetical protein
MERASPSIAERAVLAVEAMEREVNNGGYDQLFRSCAKEALRLVEALRRIGCPKTAALTERALGALKIKGPITAAAIEDAMDRDDEARDAELGKCDAAYYRGGAVGPIEDRLFAYVKANAADIRLGPDAPR